MLSGASPDNTALMAYQLRCTVKGDGASGAFLYEDDAIAALGSSELLRVVSDWATSKATFARRNGLGKGLAIEQHYQVTTAGPLINHLMREYHAGAPALWHGTPR